MGKPIKNPYVANYSKAFRSWVVSKRWMCKDKLQFLYICHTKNQAGAQFVARALNTNHHLGTEDESSNNTNNIINSCMSGSDKLPEPQGNRLL